jgi:hypothetical protein
MVTSGGPDEKQYGERDENRLQEGKADLVRYIER